MKIKSECIPCLIDRAKFEADIIFETEEEKLKALVEIMRRISENLSENSVPAVLGTIRERILMEFSGKKDPYKELKEIDIKAAKEILGIAKSFYEEKQGLEALLRIAATSNSMEYGVRGHEFNVAEFKQQFKTILNENLVGNLEEVEKAFSKYSKILYLLDNAGEAIFDIFIAEELKKLGKEIILSPKSEPIINDITASELREFAKEFEIVPSGACIGVILEEVEEEFKKLLFNKEYLIFAKGMGHYETISEFHDKLKGRIIHVFRAKCESVSKEIGVKRGSLVVKLVV